MLPRKQHVFQLLGVFNQAETYFSNWIIFGGKGKKTSTKSFETTNETTNQSRFIHFIPVVPGQAGGGSFKEKKL